LQTDLKQQATDATLGHAQALSAPSDAQLADIVNFELGTYTAQALDWATGPLMIEGALGGAVNLSVQPYYPGINDAKGNDPTGATFNPASMTLFAAWATLPAPTTPIGANLAAAQAAVAAGENIFNTAPLAAGGGGVTHCATCHDTPNIGNRSLSAFLDVGTARAVLPQWRCGRPVASGQLLQPAVPNGLTQEQMSQLVAFLSSL
jgi:mono/diheme cytochrome c family protein